jgi:tripartite-type tricarboxylate transporter receptor subunit TctC
VKRRNFLKLGAAFAAMPVAARGASALDYPTRPVQVIVGQAAASSSDITARLVSQFLSQHLGQQFVVEVRPARPATSPPSSSCALRRMATRCFW